MEYKPLKTEVHELQDGSPGHDNEAILAKLMSLEVTDVRHLSQMPDFRNLCKRRMRLMWTSPKEGETEYCPCVGNRTMEAAQQHILTWAAAAHEDIASLWFNEGNMTSVFCDMFWTSICFRLTGGEGSLLLPRFESDNINLRFSKDMSIAPRRNGRT